MNTAPLLPNASTQDALLERTAEIIATARDAIITIDGRQRIVMINAAATQMFGLPARQALGQPLEVLIPLPHREAHRGHVDRFARGNSIARSMGAAIRALTGRRVDGQEFPIEASISRLGEGAEVLMTVMVRDVTEVREAERSRQARAAVEAANCAKNEFLSRMSHEMRTPLNAVLGWAQLLQASLDERLTAQERQQFGLMQAAGLQLLTLIDEVLELARLEPGSAPQPKPATSLAGGETSGQPSGTVLYIEDNAVNALLVEEVLKPWPAVRLVVADHGAAGIEQARLLQPDLVLLDMQLPDMDGLQVLQLLHSNAATRDLKIVALSANAMEQDVAATLRAGACAYWTKPIDFAPFLDNVRALLLARRSTAA